jgi:excisionase family DNA binding protein
VFTHDVNEHQKTTTATGELLTEQQLAAQWHTTPRHIRRLRVESDLPYIKLGRLVRFDPVDVMAWLAARKHTAVAS